MANTFINKAAAAVTTITTIYTVPAATTSVVTGLNIANTAGADTTATVTIVKAVGPVTSLLVSSTPVPANSNLAVLSNNNRLVLMTGDILKVTAAASCDVFLSAMEIT